MYSYEELLDYFEEEDITFIRLAFCDIKGNLKNMAIMKSELEGAFKYGVSFDGSAIDGFGDEAKSDLFLKPDPSTLTILPWRSFEVRVVRMFCDIYDSEGNRFSPDGRYILKQAVQAAADKGITCNIGAEFEFYLFKTDDDGKPTIIPIDSAGYFDIAPDDKGENIRREICCTLSEMGIQPECSHHEEGPGQQEIDFKFADALKSADNAITFKNVVRTVAMSNGVHADFSPKPLQNKSGNGMHINISIKSDDGKDYQDMFMAGIMHHIKGITAFLNPTEESYERLGGRKAPKYISWSHENRSQLIRIPASRQGKRFELRSADPSANPYIAFALLIYAGLDGIEKQITLPMSRDVNLYSSPNSITDELDSLPDSLSEARALALESELVLRTMPQEIIDSLY